MKHKKNPRVAIIGASGMVGRELIQILEQRSFKLSELSLFGTKKSKGEEIDFRDQQLMINELTHVDQIEADLAFFCTGAKVSIDFIDKLAQKGCISIDKSSAYRLREDVPLIAFEVNGHLIKEMRPKIIANPNCVVTPLTQVLLPIHKLSPLTQVVVSTYQAVSGAGLDASNELDLQVRGLFNMREVKSPVLGKQIAFNILPFIPANGDIDEEGKTDEEIKVIMETKKILNLNSLAMEVTCVRVPVFNGHSMSVTIGCEKAISVEKAREVLSKSLGVKVIDDPSNNFYPTPLEANGKDETLVGRIRKNTSHPFGITLWISSDNLRSGAALNAVKIAENILWE
jgi:aspartate-semialdehyde dehydrogenase